MMLEDKDLEIQRMQTDQEDRHLRLPIEPDFIIIGTMKSGTTSLHHIMNKHPRVYMPRGEVQLFSVDDIEQNPVLFTPAGRHWTYQHFDQFFDTYAAWYRTLYSTAQPHQLLGEDAPSYLPSRKAIDRIAQYLPEAKLIVLLRDPVARLYSQYWHWVRRFRAIYSLEDTIRFQHGNLLQRSYYEEQLRYCFEQIPRVRVRVVLFEEFIRDQKRIVGELLDWLGIEAFEDWSGVQRHHNKGSYPLHVPLVLWRNRVLRQLYGRHYQGKFPNLPAPEQLSLPARATLKVLKVVDSHTRRKPVPMQEETYAFLTRLLYERNAGLPELLDRDLAVYWPTFREHVSLS